MAVEGSNKINNFYGLDAWKVSHSLVLETYKATETFPTKETYSLIDQMRRASSSITANIAEGFGRFYYKDKQRFYFQARGSVIELQNFFILGKDLGYIKSDDFENLFALSERSTMLINGLIRSIEKKK